MLVLVTRPREQAEETARLLRAAGHDVLVDPVLEVRSLPAPQIAPGEIAAVAITSANAAPALAALPPELPVFAVGEATAHAAHALGREIAGVGSSDGAALAELIRRSVRPHGVILHLCGREVREGLEAELVATGYVYRPAVVYEAVPTDDLSPEAAHAIVGKRLGAVLLFSPRSAALWAWKVRAAGLDGQLTGVLAACLSEAVAAQLQGLRFGSIRVAGSRDQKALLRRLEG